MIDPRETIHHTLYRAIPGPVLPILLLMTVRSLATDVQAGELSGVATLTSEYIYRGLAMSDGDPAVQFGVDYAHDTGLFAGAWASTIDLANSMSHRDTELDYYVGFHHAAKGPWSGGVTLLRYTYPGQTGIYAYDYNEVLVSAVWKERYSFELGYTADLYGLGKIGRHWELRAETPTTDAWVISVALGGNDLSDIGASRYVHWDIGASARFSRLTLDLRWYGSETPGGLAAPLSADGQFVASISSAF